MIDVTLSVAKDKEVNLGHEHYISYVSWKPDDLESNRRLYGTPLPRVEKFGIAIRHPKPGVPGVWCRGYVQLDVPELRLIGNKDDQVWRVESWTPLTLTPSVACKCGDHGFIREGRWVPA